MILMINLSFIYRQCLKIKLNIIRKFIFTNRYMLYTVLFLRDLYKIGWAFQGLITLRSN